MKGNKIILIISIIFIEMLLSLVGFSHPNITNVENSNTVLVGTNVSIYATVVDNATDTKVYLNFIYPINETYEMTKLDNTTYFLNYTPTEAKPYIFNITANSSSGNSSSGLYYFRSVENVKIPINVEVVASCKASIIIYCPSKQNNCHYFVQNQTVPIFGFVENSGNVPINETTRMEVRNSNGTLTGWFMGGDQKGMFSDNEVHELGLYEDQFFWGIWFTDTNPYGNYTVDIYTNVSSLFDRYHDNETTTLDELNTTDKNCTIYTEEVNTTDNTTNTTKTENVTYAYCYYINTTTCSSVPSGEAATIVTNQTSNKTVDGMYENSTAYYGTGLINGKVYNVYTFRMSGCSDYCYACTSEDQSINTSTECNYESSVIPSTNQTVQHVDPNGQNVTFTGFSTECNYIKTVYNCTVNETTNETNCTVYKYCYSFSHVNSTFEIVERIGNINPINKTLPAPKPTPQPTPSPTPSPSPMPGMQETPGERPKIKIVITPIKPNWEGYQEEYTPVIINVTNIGDAPVENITIAPILPDGWLYVNSTISFLNVSETVNRTIFLDPKYLITPATYAIPVKAFVNNTTADVNYFWFKVLPGRNMTKIKIVEMPEVVGLKSNTNTTIPILLKNIGKVPLHNITFRLENAERCVKGISYNSGALQINETGSFSMILASKTGPQVCNATLIVGTKEGAYAFAPIVIKVSPPFAFFKVKWPITAILIFLLTLILFVMLRHEKKKKKEDRNFGKVFITLLIIDILLIIYVLLWVFGFVPLY